MIWRDIFSASDPRCCWKFFLYFSRQIGDFKHLNNFINKNFTVTFIYDQHKIPVKYLIYIYLFILFILFIFIYIFNFQWLHSYHSISYPIIEVLQGFNLAATLALDIYAHTPHFPQLPHSVTRFTFSWCFTRIKDILFLIKTETVYI